MGAAQQLKDQMNALWDKNEKKIIDDLSDEDYYNHNKAEFLEWYKPHGDHGLSEDGTDEEYIREHLVERFSDFLHEFDNNANDDGNKLIVYRCLSVDDQDEFLFRVAHGEPAEGHKGLGVFWSWDKEKAGCHWGSGSSGQGSGDVVVEALVDVKDIDVEATLRLNLSPSTGEDEAEIRVREGAKLEVLGVHTSDDEYISPLDEGLDPIPMTANFYAKYPTLAKVLLEVSASCS